MTKTTTTMMMTAALGMALFAVPAPAAEQALESKVVEKMSREASTPEQHANVAKHYRLRAQTLEAKAEKHEAEAQKMRTAVNPMATKWPALVSNSSDRERRLAMEARRAAQECYARAERHVQLAVEGQLVSN